MTDYFLLGFVGLIAGLLAGLFGIGGGVVIVPALIFLFERDRQGLYATQLAIGSSLASIFFMGLASSFTHYKRKAVAWKTLCCLAPFIVVGTIIGSQIAGHLNGLLLKKLFGAVLMVIAITMLFRISERECEIGTWKWPVYIVGGILIGAISALFGTGGGTMTVPLLVLLLDKPIRIAVGTASAAGVVIALFGTIGFIVQGRQQLSEMPFGFVAPQSALLIALFGCMIAPLGAALAHRIDTQMLSRFFAVLLMITSLLLIRS